MDELNLSINVIIQFNDIHNLIYCTIRKLLYEAITISFLIFYKAKVLRSIINVQLNANSSHDQPRTYPSSVTLHVATLTSIFSVHINDLETKC